jgi:nucleoid-associated protein YgaU
MYLLDRAQLSSRNIVSMKPIDDVKTAGKKPAVAAKPPTPPKVAHGTGHQAPKLEAPKPPAMPKSPQIRLPLKPKASPAPKHDTHLAAAPKPAAHAAAPKHDAHAPAKPDAHAPKAAAPAHAAPKPAAHAVAPKAAAPKHDAHSAPKLDAPKLAAAPHAAVHTDAGHAAPKAALPAAPHKPAYKPQPVTPAAHAAEAHDSHDTSEHSVMVPKRVPAPQTADAAGGSGGYYRVKAGDTLSKIAKRQLGSAALWPELAAANRGVIKNPHFIRVGQRIALPQGTGQMAKHHTTTTRHYVVKHGDSLFRIAGEQLGDSTQWNKIFQLNKTAIANPRFIYPGQRLTLPG